MIRVATCLTAQTSQRHAFEFDGHALVKRVRDHFTAVHISSSHGAPVPMVLNVIKEVSCPRTECETEKRLFARMLFSDDADAAAAAAPTGVFCVDL